MSDLAKRLADLSPARRELLYRRLRQGQAEPPASGAMPVEALKAEAVLDPAIDPAAVAAASHETAAILLTGATGFLGAFLLHELLRQTQAVVYCLVRAASEEEGLRRLADNLAAHRLPAEHLGRRIVAVAGDLALPLLGLDQRQFERFAGQIDVIHHCGAVVRWTYPYQALRAANVGGTHEVLRLASTVKVKPVHYISTVGVFSSPHFAREVVLETDDLEDSGPLYVGYAQSKWVAEKLVRLAGARGLPVSIYRPNTTGHSQTGVSNLHDHLYLLLRGCVELGSAPALDLTLWGAPVDFVSQALVYLSTREDAVGQTFHLVHPDGVRWKYLVAGLRAAGYAIRKVPYDEWVPILLEAAKGSRSHILTALSPFFSEAMFDRARLPRFDCRRTSAALAGTSLVCPPLNAALWRRYLSYLIECGHLERPHR
jgi:thioester reductase-like protein